MRMCELTITARTREAHFESTSTWLTLSSINILSKFKQSLSSVILFCYWLSWNKVSRTLPGIVESFLISIKIFIPSTRQYTEYSENYKSDELKRELNICPILNVLLP